MSILTPELPEWTAPQEYMPGYEKEELLEEELTAESQLEMESELDINSEQDVELEMEGIGQSEIQLESDSIEEENSDLEIPDSIDVPQSTIELELDTEEDMIVFPEEIDSEEELEKENEEHSINAEYSDDADIIEAENLEESNEIANVINEMEEDYKLNHLLNRLDISDSIRRMNETAREDMADVIERDDEVDDLMTAIPATESQYVMEEESTEEETLEYTTTETEYEVSNEVKFNNEDEEYASNELEFNSEDEEYEANNEVEEYEEENEIIQEENEQPETNELDEYSQAVSSIDLDAIFQPISVRGVQVEQPEEDENEVVEEETIEEPEVEIIEEETIEEPEVEIIEEETIEEPEVEIIEEEITKEAEVEVIEEETIEEPEVEIMEEETVDEPEIEAMEEETTDDTTSNSTLPKYVKPEFDFEIEPISQPLTADDSVISEYDKVPTINDLERKWRELNMDATVDAETLTDQTIVANELDGIPEIIEKTNNEEIIGQQALKESGFAYSLDDISAMETKETYSEPKLVVENEKKPVMKMVKEDKPQKERKIYSEEIVRHNGPKKRSYHRIVLR